MGKTEPLLRIVASHDLALLQLRDLAIERKIAVDLQVRGSSESLAAYARGECDLAGFHLTVLENEKVYDYENASAPSMTSRHAWA